MIRRKVKDFNPDHIFDCGQCFRWDRQQDGSYSGTAYGKVVNVRVEQAGSVCEGELFIDNAQEDDWEKLWKRYFDIDRDYGRIKRVLAEKDSIIMKKAIEHGCGIRILRQQPWEALVSFIISQNNNIPRIKKNINGLSSSFGEPAGNYGGKDYYDIPTPDVLACLTLDDLAPLHLGYRARYLIETAKAVCSGKKIEADHLTDFCGVGPKVANCVALFALDRFESFPIDTWVRQLMHEFYGFDEKDVKGMASFAEDRFGEYGGIAQQYLFYYMRDYAGRK